jgi:hypothetical protein
MVLPGYLKHFSVAYYLQGLVPHTMPGNSIVSLIQSIVRDVPSLVESLVYLGLIEVGCLWLAMRLVTNREYVLEQ